MARAGMRREGGGAGVGAGTVVGADEERVSRKDAALNSLLSICAFTLASHSLLLSAVPWPQVYDPLHNRLFSTLLAALPVGVLLGGIALFRIRAHLAALLGLAVALVIALAVYRMPGPAAAGAIADGAAYGFFPIGWIVINLLFLYQLTVEKGWFSILRESVTRVTPDARIQVILVAFALGAFFEGAAGFGTPVAVTAAILIQLGFKPLSAAGLSLIANTAPVAFGALGTPIIALSGVTGIAIQVLSAMIGRQLPFFSINVPFWVVWAMAGWRGMLGVWPAALAAGASFAAVQFLVSNFHGPWLVDILRGAGFPGVGPVAPAGMEPQGDLAHRSAGCDDAQRRRHCRSEAR